MSVWNKAIGDITFSDVATFCQQRHREGPRLDYKREFNAKDHHKLICAFANTIGGTIILGIDGDENNEPSWPPAGISNSSGLADRIIQQAQDAIYPPVRPQVGPLLIDPASGKSVMIVRVDESPEAPHAVDGGTKILVYERTDSVNKPWTLAHVDRIEYLANRRRRYEQDRENLIQQAIARGRRYLNAPALALRWASIIPVYPWRKLCDPDVCFNLHSGMRPGRAQVQRFPGGSFALVGAAGPDAIQTITAEGHMFIMEYPRESAANTYTDQNNIEPKDFLTWVRTVQIVNSIMFSFAKPFFDHDAVELPGLLQFDVGFINVFGKQMMEDGRIGQPFPDDEFRAQVVFPVEGLIKQNVAEDQRLFQEIRFGFDLL